MRPSVSGTRPEKRLLERSSVCSRGSAPSSGGSRPVMLLFCRSLKKTSRETGSVVVNIGSHNGRKKIRGSWPDCLHLLEMGEVGDPPGQSPRQALARHSPENAKSMRPAARVVRLVVISGARRPARPLPLY